MKLSQRVDHLLREYNYKRRRGSANNKVSNNFQIEDYLSEVDLFIDEITEEINKFLSKSKR